MCPPPAPGPAPANAGAPPAEGTPEHAAPTPTDARAAGARRCAKLARAWAAAAGKACRAVGKAVDGNAPAMRRGAAAVLAAAAAVAMRAALLQLATALALVLLVVAPAAASVLARPATRRTPLVAHAAALADEPRKADNARRQRALAAFLPYPESNSGDCGKHVFLTGATGFVGTAVLRTLLLSRDALGVERVAVLVRPKRGQSADERLAALLADDALRDVPDDAKRIVAAIPGDATQPDFGLHERDAKQLRSEHVTHVLHCAAAVAFNLDLADAARANITSSLLVQAYARNWGATMVYVSTAFVHGDQAGTRSAPLPCALFDLSPMDAEQLYHSMLGSGALAAKAMRRFGFPNSYALSKAIAEHLLLRDGAMDVRIVRPSIVGPAWATPWAGWAGTKPSTLVAGGVLYLARRASVWPLGPKHIAAVPVDVVARAVVRCGLGKDSPRIYTAAWRCGCSSVADSNSDAQVRWSDWSRTVIQLGALRGWAPRALAYGTHMVCTEAVSSVPWTQAGFRALHATVNKAPSELLLHALRRVRPSEAGRFEGALRMLDLPQLFHPFTARDYEFESSFGDRTLEGFDGEEYLVASCIAAVDGFLANPPPNLKLLKCKPNSWRRHALTPPPGASTLRTTAGALLWSLTQPLGNAAHRILGFLLTLIFASLGMELTVDVASFAALARSVRKNDGGSPPPVVVLAPTHRSVLDFLILSYVVFALPELGLAMPQIAAAEEFAALPMLSWLARASGAFFVRRRLGRSDERLASQVALLKRRRQRMRAADPPLTLEVFVEGTRSRDRRFGKPKTGFLKVLQETGGEHVVVPLAISYERTPEQARFVNEGADAGIRVGTLAKALASHFGLPKLLARVGIRFGGGATTALRTRIGRVHVCAGDPVRLAASDNAGAIASTVVRRQMQLIHVTTYHVNAVATCLGMPPADAEVALRACGAPFMEESSHVPTPPRGSAETWAVALHCLHYVAPLLVKEEGREAFASAHGGDRALGAADAHRWHAWFLGGCSGEATVQVVDPDKERSQCVSNMCKRLVTKLVAADAGASAAAAKLAKLGVPHPRPEHVLRHYPAPPGAATEASAAAPPQGPLARAASAAASSVEGDELGGSSPGAVRPVFVGSGGAMAETEAFGAWGFEDTRFVLRPTPADHGQGAAVLMGNRYELCGRAMPDLVKYFEGELGVADLAERAPLPNADVHAPPSVPASALGSAEVDELRAALGPEGEVATDAACRCRHGTGHSQEDMMALRGSRPMPRVPDVVVWPDSEQAAASLCALASERAWCLIPYGGGTNVTHSLWCPPKDVDPRPMVCVDMRRLKKVHWVNADDGVAHVDAGIVGRDLVAKLREHGVTLGHEPDSLEFSTLGGWVATRASGMKQTRYGNIEDIVRSVRVVTPRGVLYQHHDHFGADSTVRTAFGRTSTGTSLTELALGSEGCLGLITSVVVKVRPLPAREECDAVVFSDWGTGLRFCRTLARSSIRPVSTRLVDNAQFRLGAVLRGRPGFWKGALSRGVLAMRGIDPKCAVAATLLFEGSREEVAAQRAAVRVAAAPLGGVFAGEATGRSGYRLTFAIAYLRDFALTHRVLGESFETFVPWSLLKECVARVRRRVALAHASRGLPGVPLVSARVTQLYDEGACVYFYLATDVRGVADASGAFAGLEREAREEVLSGGGSLSHHHGVGKLRADMLKASPAFREMVREMKRSVDPGCVFGARNGAWAGAGGAGTAPSPAGA